MSLCVSFGLKVRSASANRLGQGKAHSPSAIEAGRQIFTSTCAGCHGLDGRGGEHAPNIATRAEVQRLTDQQIFHIVRDGSASGAMPAFGVTFDATQIRAVVQYLRVLQGTSGAAALPGDPKAGKSLFYGKAGCSGCHMVHGEGGFIAGDLTNYASAKSPQEIHAAIVSPTADIYRRGRLATITLKSGEKITGLVRNEDNFSMQVQALDGSFQLLDKSEVQSVAYDANSLMPSDYSGKLTSQEIDAIVSFLMTTAAAAQTPAGNPAARAKKPNHDD